MRSGFGIVVARAVAMAFAALTLASFADIDLAGKWQVAGTNFNGSATLPGTLAAAGLGRRWTERDFQVTMDLPQSEALVQEWQYVGKAVWRRTVVLSEADCKHPLELFLERVMWKSEAFWDGVSLGVRDSLSTPHVHPIPAPTPGKHELRIEIDNSCFYGFSRQGHAYGPNMQAIWNGVLGDVSLRRAHPLRAARVFADAPAKRALRVEVPIGFTANLDTVSIAGLGVLSVSEGPSPFAPDRKMLSLSLASEPDAWGNVPKPPLYVLSLTDQAAGFTRRIRFGFRTWGVKGHSITLNGNRIFTRGNVENANFAKDGIPWMSKDEWARMLKPLRDEDGVDTIRFHTWCPPKAAFDAADELGMMLQPEAGIWTDSWMSDGDEVGNGKPVDGFVRRELRAIVDAYGDSPSFLSLSIGNELGSSNFPVMGDMIREVRRHDPRHLYYASSARDLSGADDFLLSHKVLGKGLARERLLPRTDWDYEELYGAAKVPVVAHEIGQWPVYPIWDELLSQFTGTMRPWNLSRHRDTAARKGAIRFQGEYHAASAKLNRLLYKEEVESFLRTPSCAGLQLLDVQDYTGQAEALVGWRDPFYHLKPGFRDLPPFSTVWGQVSFLARFPRFTYEVGDTFRAKLQVRNLKQEPIAAGTRIPYSIVGQSGEIAVENEVAPGELAMVGGIEIPLTDAMTRGKQELRFGTNRWNFWVYPKEEASEWPEGVTVTRDLGEMRKALAAGRTVLYTGESHKSAKGQFNPVYWIARWFPVANTTSAALGTWFDVSHPALAGFVTDDFTDWQWYSLSEGATIHALRGVPSDYRPIALSVNDFHFSDLTATMFEALVGKGRLFVCGYDLEAKTPEARRLRASVARYLGGTAAPGTMALPETWLDDEFAAPKAADLSGAVYDEKMSWTGRQFKKTITGVPPTTGDVIIDLFLPEAGLTSGRGIIEGHPFETPFASDKGAKMSVSLPVIREDFLDGKIDVEINLMTGPSLGVERIRIVPKH